MSKGKKNWKKAEKILKAKTKARYGKNSNFQIFFSFLGLIGARNSCVPVFLVFEDLKAKKAAPISKHRKYVNLQLKLSKFGLPTLKQQLISVYNINWDVQFKVDQFITKNMLGWAKFFRIQKIVKIKVLVIQISNLSYFNQFLCIVKNWDPPSLFLDINWSTLNWTSQFML